MRIITITDSSTEAYEAYCAYKVQAQADHAIPTGRDTISVCKENFVSRGFPCSPRATDNPNVAVNTRQN